MHSHDLIVIGAGPGGYTHALECARRGIRTLLLEERDVPGGTCLNVGCIPSKALLESSAFFHRVRHETVSHGIIVSHDGIKLNLDAMMARKNAIVRKLSLGIATLMEKRKVELLHGRAAVIAPDQVECQSRDGKKSTKFSAPRIVLATGSVPATLPHIPFDGKQIIDSTDALSLPKVPASLAVIGGGAVGLELGSLWNRLGSKVTIIEAMNQVVPGCDIQASKALASALKKQGLTVLTDSMVESAEVSTQKVTLNLREKETEVKGEINDIEKKEKTKGNERKIEVERVLVAVGREANIESALSGNVHPERSPDGKFLKVDDNYQTSIPGLYAIGDLIGNPMLAHKAEEDALALASVFAGDGHPPWSGPVPGIVYTEPELAWAGQSEEELKAQNMKYEKGHFSYAANARALASGMEDGFVKLLSSAQDGRLLGVAIVGHCASELIAEPVSVMAMGGCAGDIALTIHGHPSFSEITREAAMSLTGKPLHKA